MAPATATATRRRLDRATVVTAAYELLDDEGLGALSMARLGERLGVTAMALYRHVADRRDLETAVVERVLADLAEPVHDHGEWAEGVAAWMRQVRRHWLEHPWLGSLLGTSSELSPPWVAVLDRLAQLLAEAGLTTEAVARELVRISRITTGVLALEVAAPLPHAARQGAAMVATLPPAERERWRPIIDALARYGNDDLFADIVEETIGRLRRARPAD